MTFRYRGDPEGIRQYGLVAEKIRCVYPELVTRGADGQIQTVNYLTLSSMLLKELQQRTAENRHQAARLATVEQRLAALERTVAAKDQSSKLAAAFGR